MFFKKRFQIRKQLQETKIKVLNEISAGIAELETEFTRLRILDSISSVMDGYIWFKDNNGIYKYASPRWLSVFFGLPENYKIEGKNDIDLLNQYRERTGNEHTFGEMCVGTDAHCMTENKTCRYIEIGFIAKKLFILDVVKTPVKDKTGNLIGTVGFARDRTKSKDVIQEELKTYVRNNWVEDLDTTSFAKDVVAYYIQKTSIPFLNDTFIPREDHECQKN